MADKTLKSLNFGGADIYFPLPIVSANDNNKILSVVNGEWVVKEAPSCDGTGQYVWSKKDSADGPVTGYVISNDGEKYPDGGWKDGVFYTLELDQRILIGIQVTTAPTTVEYTEGDSLDLTGLVVTATFNDGSTEDVTSQCIMSPAAGTVLATTDTSVNISYTYKGTTLSTAQIIVVEVAVVPYLSFLGNEDFTLKTYNATKNWDGTLEYSTDTITWNTWNGTEISSVGNNLYLRGTGNTKITGNSTDYRFVFTGTNDLKIACEGNIENLLDYATVRSGGHPTMASHCYYYMFRGCKALTTAPELPATTLTESCYHSMFRNCTSLTTAPALPATTLANYCYKYMFYGCASLTTAPALPATTLAKDCYWSMFNDCTKIKMSTTKTGEYQTAYRIPKSGTGTTATNALSDMFANTGGTFTETPEINTTYYTSNTVV